MGQKVNPYGIRLGIVTDYKSTWFAEGKQYRKFLSDDIKVREYLFGKLKAASVSKICIERPPQNAKITIHTARPGIVIGRKGEDAEKLKDQLTKIVGVPVQINIEEIRKPELDSQLVADSIAQQLEKRVMFRRAMKRAMQNAMRQGAEGVKISISGRLGGAEIARTEWAREGRVPLHTFRANIDYATSEALTTYGIIGVKVWIFKGEVLPSSKKNKQISADKDPVASSAKRSEK